MKEFMHPRTQKIFASAGGMLVFILAIAWGLFTSSDIASLIGHKSGLASEFLSEDAIYKKFGDIYTAFSVVGIALAAGLNFTLLAWERRPKRWRIEVAFWILLAISLPMSVINFATADLFVSRSQQLYLNIIQVFLTAVCSLQLSRRPADSDSEIVLKYLALFMLLAFGLFIPLLFSFVWLLNWQQAISLATSKSFSPAWVSTISGVAALSVSIQQYRLARSKQGEPSSHAGIIVPR